MRRKHLYDDGNSTFNIRTRQNCNVVYDDDSFRVEGDEDKKEKTYKSMMENDSFSIDGNLQLYSPKFFEIMKNIEKFLDSDNNPTGKILYYSDFRHESGSEAFEKILLSISWKLILCRRTARAAQRRSQGAGCAADGGAAAGEAPR